MREGSKRRLTIDLVRGLAVLLMVLAHCVYFFHDYSNTFLANAEKLGNTVCFVTFLLLAGAVSYLAYLKKDAETSRIKKRLVVFVIAYYGLAFFVLAKSLSSAHGSGFLKIILNVITFRNLPSYTEYIPPFIVFSLLVLWLKEPIKKISSSLRFTLITTVLFYVAGSLLYRIHLPAFLVPWQAFLVGAEGFYRFPILQYAPIFLIGLYWGKFLSSDRIDNKAKKEFPLDAFSIALIGVIILVSLGNITSGVGDIFKRWPPSPGFLLIGLIFAFGISYLFARINDLKKLPLLRDLLLVLGQNAFAIFWAHIFILSFYQMAGGSKVDSLFLFFVLFLLVIIISLALATFIPFNFKVGLTLIRKNHDDEEIIGQPVYQFGTELYAQTKHEYSALKRFFFPLDDGASRKRRLIKKRHLLALSLLFLLVSFVVIPKAEEEITYRRFSEPPTDWWNNDFTYNQTLELENIEPFLTIKTDVFLEAKIDHQTLVDKGESSKDGSDLRVIFWDGKNFAEIPFGLENMGTHETKILFKSMMEISPGRTVKNYYLYYGSPLAEKDYIAVDSSSLWQYKYKVSFLAQKEYPYKVTASKKWFLKGVDSRIKIAFVPEDSSLDPSEVSYTIRSAKGKISEGLLARVPGGKWEKAVGFDDLDPGKYTLMATAKMESGEIQSQKTGFYVSYPLYVTWTIDWEGYDVGDGYLKAMANIAEKYKIPMTHLFSPRIYTAPEISEARRDYLTQWVKQRQISNDEEIGMHIHMFYDLVSSAGIEPKHDPNWGDKGDGYGSLTTNYSIEEMEKILQFSLQEFEQRGLPNPVSYRCGGWFCGVGALQALANEGFKIDSSGRTKYTFGPNKQPGVWDLKPTSQPYYPSSSNQNMPGSGVDKINILEVPDNGADSYWFSADDMINRFDLNHTNVLRENKTVTFLSHPHWFDAKEQEKVSRVFDHVEDYLYSSDSGPVIYTTLDEVGQVFGEEE